MNMDWKKDPRIQAMNPEKIRFLSELTEQIQKTPKNLLLNRFVTMTMEARQKGIAFSNQETELIAQVLIPYMNPSDRGRLDTLRMLSQKLAGQRRTDSN